MTRSTKPTASRLLLTAVALLACVDSSKALLVYQREGACFEKAAAAAVARLNVMQPDRSVLPVKERGYLLLVDSVSRQWRYQFATVRLLPAPFENIASFLFLSRTEEFMIVHMDMNKSCELVSNTFHKGPIDSLSN